MSFGKILEWTFSGFLVVAIISVLVAKKSNAPAFLQALGSALSSILGAVVAPATVAPVAPSTASNSLGSSNIGGLTAATIPQTTATSANTGTSNVAS